jgi:hypothetical protein
VTAILKTFLALSFGSVLLYGTNANVPVYFVPGDSGSSSCSVFDAQGLSRISSASLDFGFHDQRIDFVKARAGVPCNTELTEKPVERIYRARPFQMAHAAADCAAHSVPVSLSGH